MACKEAGAMELGEAAARRRHGGLLDGREEGERWRCKLAARKEIRRGCEGAGRRPPGSGEADGARWRCKGKPSAGSSAGIRSWRCLCVHAALEADEGKEIVGKRGSGQGSRVRAGDAGYGPRG